MLECMHVLPRTRLTCISPVDASEYDEGCQLRLNARIAHESAHLQMWRDIDIIYIESTSESDI